MSAMIYNLLIAHLAIVPVALLTGGVMRWRAARVVPAALIAALGLDEAARESSTGMALIAALFGLVVSLAYLLFAPRWPDHTTAIFARLGIGLALALSLAAIVVRPRRRLNGVPEVIVLNLLWGVGYGCGLPLVMRLFGHW